MAKMNLEQNLLYTHHRLKYNIQLYHYFPYIVMSYTVVSSKKTPNPDIYPEKYCINVFSFDAVSKNCVSIVIAILFYIVKNLVIILLYLLIDSI